MANNQCNGGLNKTREVKHIELNIKRHWNGFQPFFLLRFYQYQAKHCEKFCCQTNLYLFNL